MVKKKGGKKKAVKRSVAKPVGMGKKNSKKVVSNCKVKCDSIKGLFVRLCAISAILFLITICPKCMTLVTSINSYWYLAAAILFWAIHMTRRRCL